MKKIIKSICFSVLAFLLAIGSFFVPISSNNINSAHADVNIPQEGYTFVSSNIINALFASVSSTPSNPSFSYLLNNSYTGSEMRYFNTSFRFTVSNGSIKTYIFSYLTEDIGLTDVVSGTGTKSEEVELLSYNLTSASDADYDVYAYSGVRVLTSAGNKWTMIGQSITNNNEDDTPFEFPVVSVEIGNYTSPQFSDIVNNYTNSIIIRYNTISNHSITFFIPTWTLHDDTIFNAPYYIYRKYYLEDAFDFSNNGYYQQGFNNGKNEGLSIGYDNGYSVGSSSGYNEGLEEGKIIGAVESNDYSFFGLISAVIDTPIQLFKSLFNFNFLGVNLFAFFTSILTIGLIVFVTKLFLRR